ncbi:hypothetical protein BYT27DRAFT_7212575 [Phlegmacium glaucopus]|nr:hypothetical protein BYT27DRAFT_7212575 [Phlegmacium glaucopus]
MGDSLLPYLAMKVHPLIETSHWRNIIVVGRHDRTGDSVVGKEKTDKPFNWMRPSARFVGDDIHIQCFPGSDYVEHYAAILATYLNITKGAEYASKVLYEAVAEGETIHALEQQTNLSKVPKAEVVVTGLVHRLTGLTGNTTFEGKRDDEFAWVLREFGTPKRRVLFLGCRFSFWGSISGDMVRVLARLTGADQLLYFGKLGTTLAHIQPNRWLASGSTSTVRGSEVRWQNILEPVLTSSNAPVLLGKHETLPSVLYETRDWLAQSIVQGHQVVDPEVGCMALAAVQADIKFGYVHIISDNVVHKYDEDLSNERTHGVLTGRARLYAMVNELLAKHLTQGNI